MNKACDEFAQEISSGTLTPSEGLKRHMAVCKECSDAYKAVCALKSSRKPMSKKEALAVAAILSLVRVGPSGPAKASSDAASSVVPAMAGAKGFAVICCSVLAVISAVFLYDGGSFGIRSESELSQSVREQIQNENKPSTASSTKEISNLPNDAKHTPLKPGPKEAQIKLYAPNQEVFGR